MAYAAGKVGPCLSWPTVCDLCAVLSILYINVLGLSFLFNCWWEVLVHPPHCWAGWSRVEPSWPHDQCQQTRYNCLPHCKTGLRRLWVLFTKMNLIPERSHFLEEHPDVFDDVRVEVTQGFMVRLAEPIFVGILQSEECHPWGRQVPIWGRQGGMALFYIIVNLNSVSK